MKNQSNQVKERPIIFSGEMVKAILDGKKTMTRRAVKTQPRDECTEIATSACFGHVEYRSTSEDRQTQSILAKIKCPYGKIGDRLWVRETWAPVNSCGESALAYKADNEIICLSENEEFLDEYGTLNYTDPRLAKYAFADWADDLVNGVEGAWKSPITMPRWASRILLEITDIRVERLNDISGADAVKEGIVSMTQSYPWQDEHSLSSPISYEVRLFTKLWNDINAKKGNPWSSNPWVWVVEFKVVEVA